MSPARPALRAPKQERRAEALPELLKRMSPRINEGIYYIACVDETELMALAGYAVGIVDIFREKEGLSVVLSEEIKPNIEIMAKESVQGPFAWISLGVHSSLAEAGLLARIATALAERKIPANTFSAYHHDHFFVPYAMKEDALAALKSLAGGKAKASGRLGKVRITTFKGLLFEK